DYPIGRLSAGNHTIKIAIDTASLVENESSGEYSRTITVRPSSSCLALAANISPSNGGTVTTNPPSNCSGGLTKPAEPVIQSRQIAGPTASITSSSLTVNRSVAQEDTFAKLIAKVQSSGPVRIIVGLRIPFQVEGSLPTPQLVQLQR